MTPVWQAILHGSTHESENMQAAGQMYPMYYYICTERAPNEKISEKPNSTMEESRTVDQYTNLKGVRLEF